MKQKKVKKKMVIVASAVFLLLVVIFSTLLITSGAFLPPKYLEPWKKDYSQQFTDPREQLAAHAILAPSGHNMQPWTVRLDKNNENVFYLYADSKKLVKQADPLARQTLVSQGTFLEYLKCISGFTSFYRINYL
ncbi:hypothetical protein FZC66_08795 [Priestia megaterium]|nr:hypothetical protein FZC66_08795 [Priestia megaterium]